MSSQTSSRPALTVTDVEKTFTSAARVVQALRSVSLTVHRGYVTGLIGPDGAGKTTLLRLIAGLLLPDAGRITVLGLDATRQALAVQANIGYMPQRFGLYEDLSVQENLDLYADLQGVPGAMRAARYQELMQMTGLEPFTRRLAGKLSGGMKQKLGLACTLVRTPELLLLDEPTVGVDPVSRRELWAIVYRLVEENGMSVLLSTAYLDEAERCTDVILLHEGRVLGQGAPGEFSQRMNGRTFVVSTPRLKNRLLQAQLRTAPGVIDAVVQASHVRLIMAEPGSPLGLNAPELNVLGPDSDGLSIEPAPPRFEDYFIAELRGRQSRTMATPATVARLASSIEQSSDRVIQVRNVARRFGAFYAVEDLSFDVCRGEIFGLLGANGAGKTTTFRMLCGLLPASAGTLTVAGHDLRHAAATARAKLGYMAQKFSLYGNLSVQQNLNFFSACYGLSGSRRRERLAWALREFELTKVAAAMSGELPTGYKQRLAMACALMHEPEILFLDEPTSGVDPLARREFWQRINTLAQAGVTVLVTTHFMEEAEYCDRLAIMAAGKILTLDRPAAIKAQARSPTTPEPSLEDAFIALIQSPASGVEAA
ncbi:MAG: ATP-binding cassette domain-containing protein [Gammaproteobacteria bacterium]